MDPEKLNKVQAECLDLGPHLPTRVPVFRSNTSIPDVTNGQISPVRNRTPILSRGVSVQRKVDLQSSNLAAVLTVDVA